jgi:hypothetical protein
VLQNRHIFEFLQNLVDDHDVVWESAGALREGRKVFVCMRLPQTVTIDAGGIADEIVPFVVALNSHDGSSQAQVVVTPWRPTRYVGCSALSVVRLHMVAGGRQRSVAFGD